MNFSDNPNLLLSSMECYWSVINPLVDAVNAASMCEIGVGNGSFSRLLINYCVKNGIDYCGIDPSLSDEFIVANRCENARFLRQPSLKVLPELQPQDICFIDGDHNYYTVINELRLLASDPNRIPLIFLHDVSWPWGKRDQYCDPKAIPDEFRHEYSVERAVVPGETELRNEGGFRGDASDYGYGAAVRECGVNNGVMSAVEAFIEEDVDRKWELITIPAIFGLGILYAPEKCATKLVSRIKKLSTAIGVTREFIEMLEENRIRLFMMFNNNLEKYDELLSEYRRLKSYNEDIKVHNAGLKKQVTDSLKAYKELKSYNEDIKAHNTGLKKHAADLLEAYKELKRYVDDLEKTDR